MKKALWKSPVFALLSLAGLAGLVGCSTQIQVAPLKPNLAANDVVNGLPFRTRERYEVKLYRLNGQTYEAVETKMQTVNLANLDALHVLRVEGGPLSDGSVTVKMRSDNTLESVKVVSTSKGQEALTALGKGMKDLADADATRAKDAASKGKASEGELTAGEDTRLAALEARQSADLAAVELSELSATATQAQRTAAEQKVQKLKLVANQKARRAGLQPPFSDAGS
jgi:hypothetical protein